MLPNAFWAGPRNPTLLLREGKVEAGSACGGREIACSCGASSSGLARELGETSEREQSQSRGSMWLGRAHGPSTSFGSKLS